MKTEIKITIKAWWYLAFENAYQPALTLQSCNFCNKKETAEKISFVVCAGVQLRDNRHIGRVRRGQGRGGVRRGDQLEDVAVLQNNQVPARHTVLQHQHQRMGAQVDI